MKCQPPSRAPLLLLLPPALVSLVLLGLRVQRPPADPAATPPAPPGRTAAFQWLRKAPAPPRHPLQPPYPHPYRFLLNEPHKCRRRAPYLVLLVASAPPDLAGRAAIRQTWGAERGPPGLPVLRLFLLGVQPVFGPALQPQLREESRAHGDLLQQDFLDTYHNLTLKTLMGLEWVAKHCPGAAYVLKADSDVFLNLDYLAGGLLAPPPRRDLAAGHIYRGTGPLRSRGSKWFVPREVYAADSYPPYAGGPAYVLSAELARRVYRAAQVLPLINMEDAFVGLCLRALGVAVTDGPPGAFNMHRVPYERCRFARLAVAHHYRPEEVLRLWEDFRRPGAPSCGP